MAMNSVEATDLNRAKIMAAPYDLESLISDPKSLHSMAASQ